MSPYWLILLLASCCITALGLLLLLVVFRHPDSLWFRHQSTGPARQQDRHQTVASVYTDMV